jgi:hypothetical protein
MPAPCSGPSATLGGQAIYGIRGTLCGRRARGVGAVLRVARDGNIKLRGWPLQRSDNNFAPDHVDTPNPICPLPFRAGKFPAHLSCPSQTTKEWDEGEGTRASRHLPVSAIAPHAPIYHRSAIKLASWTWHCVGGRYCILRNCMHRYEFLLMFRSLTGQLSGRVREEERDTAGFGVIGHM